MLDDITVNSIIIEIIVIFLNEYIAALKKDSI